jgi:hypothetical protein
VPGVRRLWTLRACVCWETTLIYTVELYTVVCTCRTVLIFLYSIMAICILQYNSHTDITVQYNSHLYLTV